MLDAPKGCQAPASCTTGAGGGWTVVDDGTGEGRPAIFVDVGVAEDRIEVVVAAVDDAVENAVDDDLELLVTEADVEASGVGLARACECPR